MEVAKVWVNRYESGKLLGFADVKFALTKEGNGCMTWRGFKIFKGDDGDIQLGLPSREVMKDGEKQYFPVIKFDKEDKDSQALLSYITEEVVKEYNKGPAKDSGDDEVGDDDVPF